MRRRTIRFFVYSKVLPMKFKVYIINLDSSVDRWEQISSQCDQLGIEYERVSAVRGSELTKQEKAEVYDLSTNLAKYDKRLNDGEIGCYLSHIKCWKKIVEEELDFALILEDDASLREKIKECIAQFSLMDSSGWDYIKLFHRKRLKLKVASLDLDKGVQLHKVAKLPASTCSQFVSQVGAKKLLKHSFPIARPVDVDIQYWFERELRCFVVSPPAAVSAGFESEIDTGQHRDHVQRRPCKRIWLRVIYEINVLLNAFKMAQFPKMKG